MMAARKGIFGVAALVFGVLVLMTSDPALAQAIDLPLPDSAQEARARDLHRQLRCLVCQNQSIADSNADLARDLRIIVRERVAAGESDRQVLDFMVARYGDWVLMNPPFKATTVILWVGPGLIFLGAAVGIFFYFRRVRRQFAAAVPLSKAERQRLDALFGDSQD